MLEDLTMDKKPTNRSVQTPSKGIGTENKKDVGKLFTKSSRRREPTNSNGYRAEQNRKPAPQKGKTMDKRPRQRGQFYGGGKESAQVEECEAEVCTLYSTGSKKQNLNHLLNFHFAPRGETGRPSPRPSQQHGVRWLMSTQKHKYNKEHFLQANCQFIVRADADYSPYLADPDHLVDWDFIEQIRVPSVEPVQCPICMSAPVAAKMTRCGHIYCYPCILHYLALSDTSWHKCPICFEAIHKHHLKSVKVDSKRGHSVGQQITFQLMVRERGSLMACPVSQLEERTLRKPVLAVGETQLDTAFAKLLTADKAEVLAMIDQEVKELEVEKSENEGCPEVCFVEQALELCEKRRLNIDNKVKEAVEDKPKDDSVENEEVTNANLSSSPDENKIMYEPAFDNLPVDTNQNPEDKRNTVSTRPRYESLSSEGEDTGPTAIIPEDLEILHSLQPPTHTKNFYFYQACDGQQIYLHAVNVQMLEMMYGSLRDSPANLSGVIVEKEAGSMTVQLRRRLRYLQHLPVTAQFEVAEIELLPPMVTTDILGAFADQLNQRRKRRQKRAREERKREKKIAEVELQQMGRHRTPRLRIDSHHHFPQCGIPEDEIPPPPPRAASAESSRASSPASHRSESPGVAALALDQNSSPSFAQMLRSNANMRPRGWGWPRASEASKPRAPSPPHPADSDEESAPPPRYNLSFSDAIAAALQNASISQDQNDSQGGKKKKKKQKVLFATGMACTSN